MSVNLNCPNCGGIVGHADSSDDYKEVWLKVDNNGEPECPQCGAGDSMLIFKNNLYIGLVLLALVMSTLIFCFS